MTTAMECTVSTPEFSCSNFADIAVCLNQLQSSIRADIKLVRDDMKTIADRVTVLDSSVKYLHDENTELHNTILPNIQSKFDDERNERLKLDVWSRKWNLIVRGVPKAKITVVTRNDSDTPTTTTGSDLRGPTPDKSAWESSEATEIALKEFFHKSLAIPRPRVDRMLFQAVHRLPSGPDDKRNIIVRVLSLQDRDVILHHASKLKPGSGLSVIPDLPPKLNKENLYCNNALNYMYLQWKRK